MILGRRSYAVLGGKNSAPRLIQLGWLRWVGAGVLLHHPAQPGVPALWRAAQRDVLEGRLAVRLVQQFHLPQHLFRVLRAVGHQARALQHLRARHRLRDHRHRHRRGDLLPHHARGGDRAQGAGLPRHRAGRHPGHRARRRIVPELHAAAVRALRHAVDSAARVLDAEHAGRLSADAVGVQGDPSGAGGRQPHPRRDAARAHCARSRRRCCAPP